ncbi:hypothetical protein D3C80_762910 [compost metagenome]
MVAEVDLEAVEPTTARGEGADVHTTVAQLLTVAGGQGVAADPVVQHIDVYPFGGFLQQQGLQGAPQLVVMDDEELHQHRVTCLLDGGKDRVESCLAVDQQAHLVVRQTRHPSQPGHGPKCAIGFGVACCQRFIDPRPPVEVGHGHMHFAVGLASRLDVGVEGTTAKYQVRDQSEVGDKQQRQGPGNCTLGSAHGEHRMHGGDGTKQVQGTDQVTEEVGAVVIHMHPAVQRHCL